MEKPEIKKRIRELGGEIEAARAAGKPRELRQLRREKKQLKRETRRLAAKAKAAPTAGEAPA